jgi:hypothetical protein
MPCKEHAMTMRERLETMDNAAILGTVECLVGLLQEEATQLDRWAVEAREGGWSTQQVDPMRRRASDIRAELIRCRMT